jgi:hypothetical protein
MKSGLQIYDFLASYAFRRKALILVIRSEIRDPEKNHPRIQGVKKHRIPDPEHFFQIGDIEIFVISLNF